MTLVLLNTSDKQAEIRIIGDNYDDFDKWESGRSLAKDLLKRIEDDLKKGDYSWQDVSGIGIFQGPGSFTGLRIGITVANTLAENLNVPIVAVQGGDWQNEAVSRLQDRQNDSIVMPFYGRPARITQQKK